MSDKEHADALMVVGKAGAIATDKTVTGALEDIRKVFWRAGLLKLSRHADDEPQIVECWL